MSTDGLQIYVHGVGVLGPGLMDWQSAKAVLRGETPFELAAMPKPAATILPPTERRRASAAIRTSLTVAQQAIDDAGVQASDVATIFATSDCDAENVNYICETLAGPDRELSPTRFHNSVQNAPAGYWTIATACVEASNTVNSYDAVIAQGLLEAAVQAVSESRTVMFVAHDLPMPHPLFALRPIEFGFAVAFVLSPSAAGAHSARLDLRFVSRKGGQATAMAHAELEALRSAIPSARALPLLECVAAQRAGQISLDYGDDRWLDVMVNVPG